MKKDVGWLCSALGRFRLCVFGSLKSRCCDIWQIMNTHLQWVPLLPLPCYTLDVKTIAHTILNAIILCMYSLSYGRYSLVWKEWIQRVQSVKKERQKWWEKKNWMEKETENNKPKMSPKVLLLLFHVHIGIGVCSVHENKWVTRSCIFIYIQMCHMCNVWSKKKKRKKKTKQKELLESICYTLHNLLCGLLQTKRYSLYTVECSCEWIHTNTTMCNLHYTYDDGMYRDRERARASRQHPAPNYCYYQQMV